MVSGGRMRPDCTTIDTRQTDPADLRGLGAGARDLSGLGARLVWMARRAVEEHLTQVEGGASEDQAAGLRRLAIQARGGAA